MDQQDFIDIIGKISSAVAIILLIMAIGLVWYKITGHSPTLTDLILGLQVATLTLLVGFIYHFGKFQGKAEHFIDSNSDLKERIIKVEIEIMDANRILKKQ